MEAQNVLKAGAVRLVGDGTTISVLSDPWLPHPTNAFVTTNSEALHGVTVNSLFEIGEQKWDEELISDIFEDRDASLILSIPLNSTDKDGWWWNKERLGVYSVKSAYMWLQLQKNQSVNPDNSRCWKRFWNLKVPPKVKNMIWRAATGCLPTKSQLRMKHVNIDNVCPHCQLSPETIVHALLTCTFAKECWHQTQTHVGSDMQDHESFLYWMVTVFDTWTTEKRQEAAMMLWSIWRGRNDLVWKQKGLQVRDIVVSARMVLNQWKKAQDRTFDNFMGLITDKDGREQWELPKANTVKVNCDAATFDEPGSHSYAFVVRNDKGEVVDARSRGYMGRVSSENAEAISVREALSWTKESNWQEVTIETDCLLVVQALRSSDLMLSYFGRIIKECKLIIENLKDRHVSVVFVKRSANRVADFLAKATHSIADCIWRVTDNHPEFIKVLMDDLI